MNTPRTTACRHAVDIDSETEFACESDAIANGRVPKHICSLCPFYSPAVAASDYMAATAAMYATASHDGKLKPVSKPCGCLGSSNGVPDRPPQAAALDPDWAVLVTTARRRQNTLPTCIQSLRTAGWEPVVFSEPGAARVRGVTTFVNARRLGIWYNFKRSVHWALKHTTAPNILTVQDDAEFHPDSKSFVESILWPSNDAAFVSLYTSAKYSVRTRNRNTLRTPGVNHVRTQSLWGACAIVWPRSVLEAMTEHPLWNSWLGCMPKRQNGESNKDHAARCRYTKEIRRQQPHKIQNSDYVLGAMVNRMRLKMYFVDPSPVQHVARMSSEDVAHGSNTENRNCRRCADHSRPLAEQVTVTRTPTTRVLTLPARSPRIDFDHTITIRSSFSNADDSRRRLDISKATMIPALASQTNKRFSIVLRVHQDDPLLNERRDAWQAVGVDVHLQTIASQLDSGGRLRLLTRLDDDDAVSRDFVQQVQAAVIGPNQHIQFTNGMIFDDGHWYRTQLPGNMFASITTDDPQFEIYSIKHRQLPDGRLATEIKEPQSWVWIRHRYTISNCLDGHKKSKIRFPKHRYPGVSFHTVQTIHRQANQTAQGGESGGLHEADLVARW
jgi:hypothetical protein